ncbi:MAG: HAMP domain-containing protein [Paenibacillaceae bacterium]|nr:HAMP domain-containing protein [Paenibacillaceae bacterium]
MSGPVRFLGSLFAPKSLRLQLLSRSLLILALLLLLIGVFQYVFMQRFLYSNQSMSMRNQLLSVPPDTWQRAGQEARRGEPLPMFQDAAIAFVGTDGTVRALSGNPNAPSVPQLSEEAYRQKLKDPRSWSYRIVRDDNGVEQIVVAQPAMNRGRQAGLLQMSMPTEPLKDVLLGQLTTFLSLSALALGLGLLTFIPILRRTLVPLSTIVDTVERIDAGKLNERLPTLQGQSEIDQLAVSFNRMLERLELSFEAEREAREQMRRFVADASHELRTPLTSIHGFLEVLLRGAAQKPEQLDKALASMHSESTRLTKLVHDLLLLARLDRADREPAVQLAQDDLVPMLCGMEPQLRLLAGEREVVLTMEPQVTAVFDEDKLKQVVLNLFHNAVQHTDPHSGRIELTLRQDGGEAAITLTDNGTGIPPDHLPHLFERFYRVDSSRSRKYGGAGLGLSITKSIVDLHRGTIEVASREGEGTSFRVRLPAG